MHSVCEHVDTIPQCKIIIIVIIVLMRIIIIIIIIAIIRTITRRRIIIINFNVNIRINPVHSKKVNNINNYYEMDITVMTILQDYSCRSIGPTTCSLN